MFFKNHPSGSSGRAHVHERQQGSAETKSSKGPQTRDSSRLHLLKPTQEVRWEHLLDCWTSPSQPGRGRLSSWTRGKRRPPGRRRVEPTTGATLKGTSNTLLDTRDVHRWDMQRGTMRFQRKESSAF